MSDTPPPPPGAQPPPPSSWTPPPPAPPPAAGGYQQYGYGYGAAQPAPFAGFWIRFAAVVVDSLIIGIPSSIITSSMNAGAGSLIRLIIGVLYFGLLEGGASGQTLGKRVCGIRVVDVETRQPGIGIGRGIGRYFGRILSAIVILIGYLWMLWDPNKQTWHDKLARTVVIKG